MDPAFCYRNKRKRGQCDPRLRDVGRRLHDLRTRIGNLQNSTTPLAPEALSFSVKQICTCLYTWGDMDAEAAWQFMQRKKSRVRLSKSDFEEHLAVWMFMRDVPATPDLAEANRNVRRKKWYTTARAAWFGFRLMTWTKQLNEEQGILPSARMLIDRLDEMKGKEVLWETLDGKGTLESRERKWLQTWRAMWGCHVENMEIEPHVPPEDKQTKVASQDIFI